MLSMISKMAHFMAPADSTTLGSIVSQEGPNMVKVLPEPVWPYAKMVQLKPSRTL